MPLYACWRFRLYRRPHLRGLLRVLIITLACVCGTSLLILSTSFFFASVVWTFSIGLLLIKRMRLSYLLWSFRCVRPMTGRQRCEHI